MAAKKIPAWGIFLGQDIPDVEDPDTGIKIKAIFPNEIEAKKALEKIYANDPKYKIYKVEI